jgi:hypothetical protein
METHTRLSSLITTRKNYEALQFNVPDEYKAPHEKETSLIESKYSEMKYSHGQTEHATWHRESHYPCLTNSPLSTSKPSHFSQKLHTNPRSITDLPLGNHQDNTCNTKRKSKRRKKEKLNNVL